MSDFNKEIFIKRNGYVARKIYGDKLNDVRKVVGTNIWFDSFWRIHAGSS